VKHIGDMFCFFQGKQVLKLKTKECEQRGVQVVVAWMQRALKRKGNIEMIKAPLDNIIDACMIERALWALRCYPDANRVNRFIKKHYFSRALSYQQAIDLWTTFPHNCIQNKWLAENFCRTLWGTWETDPGFTAKREARWVLDEHPQLAKMIEEAAPKAGHGVYTLLGPAEAEHMNDDNDLIDENDIDDDYEFVEQDETFQDLGDDDWEIVGSYEEFAADIARVLDEMEISRG
jgi:hypothetical protein